MILRLNLLCKAILALLLSALLAAAGPVAKGQQMITMPKDYTDRITETDLNSVQEMMRECLGDESLVVSDHTARLRDDRVSLYVGFEPGEQGGLELRYSAHLRRVGDDGSWEPVEIEASGQQKIKGQDRPLWFKGYITPVGVEEIIGHITQYWSAQVGVGELQVTSITSSERPPLHCNYDSLAPTTSHVHYGVFATSDDERVKTHKSGELVTTDGNIGLMMCSGSSSAGFEFRLIRDESGDLAVADVNCNEMGRHCDPTVLAALKKGVERPRDDVDAKQLLEMARAALPPELAEAQVTQKQLMMHGAQEILTVQMSPVAVSEKRTVHPTVNCSRMLDPGSEWRCVYQLMDISQQVPDQRVPVTASFVDWPEKTLVQFVIDLREYLAANPVPGTPIGPIEIHMLFQHPKGVVARVSHGEPSQPYGDRSRSYDVEVNIDGDRVELVSVKPRIDE